MSLSKDNRLNMQRLQAAITQLKASNIIKRDKDIADDLGYTTATISQYQNGKKPISFAFIKHFEEKYKIQFSKIKMGENGKHPVDPTMKLLIMIAEKLNIPKNEIMKVIK